jgi:hypothetical protein
MRFPSHFPKRRYRSESSFVFVQEGEKAAACAVFMLKMDDGSHELSNLLQNSRQKVVQQVAAARDPQSAKIGTVFNLMGNEGEAVGCTICASIQKLVFDLIPQQDRANQPIQFVCRVVDARQLLESEKTS